MTRERFNELSAEYAQYDNRRIEGLIASLFNAGSDCYAAQSSGDASWAANYADTDPDSYARKAKELQVFLNVRKGIEKCED